MVWKTEMLAYWNTLSSDIKGFASESKPLSRSKLAMLWGAMNEAGVWSSDLS
jgi:hypothetical protein